MRKILTIAVPLVVFLLISLVSSVHASSRFQAALSGDQEVPPVTTDANGDAEFVLNEDGTALAFALRVSNIENILFAHIHVGEAGTNGPIIFFLARSAADFEDGVVTGVLTQRDLMPAGGIMTFADAIAAMRNGRTYANVHTQQNTGGETRGQIAPDDE